VPWFPENVDNGPAWTGRGTAWQTVPFYQGILDSTPAALLASWSDEPRVDDPRVGEVVGRSDFLDYVKAAREWLALGDATLRQVSVLHTPTRSVEEVVLELTVGGERQELPVAVVAEWDADHRLTSIRIYHSLWPLFPNHHVHSPVIEAHPNVTLPDAVARNQQARASGDLEAILETYRPDAVVHASTATGAQVHRGTDELRRLYGAPSIPGMKPQVTICAATDDGHRCAVEYKVTHFSEPKPDQVGITVYEHGGGPTISAERSYLVSCPAGGGVFEAADRSRPLRGRVVRAHLALVPRESAPLGVQE
jgi:hypothetical protein